MNWMVTKTSGFHPEADKCEHVESGERPISVEVREMDSFGIVDATKLCYECHQETKESEENEIDNCRHCGNEHKIKDLKSYRYYGFSPQAGEEPELICDVCVKLPRHQKQLEDDQREYEADMEDEDYYD